MNLSNIMRRAWALYKQANCTMRAEFAAALRAAWAEAKEFAAKVNELSKRCLLFLHDDGRLISMKPEAVSTVEIEWIRENRPAITLHISESIAASRARLRRKAG